MQFRIWNHVLASLAVFALASVAVAGVSAKGIAQSSTGMSSDAAENPESLLTEDEISRRNREVLKTLLENANKNFEKYVDRKPAVLGPPIYENSDKVSEQEIISDDLSVQPEERSDIK